MRSSFLLQFRENFTDPAYYFKQLLKLSLPAFVLFFWIYLSGQGIVSVGAETLVGYFFGIAAFNYLFTYVVAAKILEETFTEKSSVMLLKSGRFIINLVKKTLIPEVVNGLLLIVLYFVFINVAGIVDLIGTSEIIILLGVANLGYFLFCFNMAIFCKLIKLDTYADFSMRYIGFTFNGSYIPYVLTGTFWLGVITATPFFMSGAPFQIVFGNDFWSLLVPLLVHVIVQAVISVTVLKAYKLIVRL